MPVGSPCEQFFRFPSRPHASRPKQLHGARTTAEPPMSRLLSMIIGVIFLYIAALPALATDVIPLAVTADRCELVLDTGQPPSHCFLVIGSLADGRRTTR